MNISDVMKHHQSEQARTKRARVLLICGILTSLLSVAMTTLARQRKRVPAVAAPSLLDQTLPDKASDAAPYDEIDGYIEQQLERLNVPGAALAIVEGDQIVHQRGFGQTRPGGTPPSPQTPFVLGSVTKSFTALAVMQLVEAGKVDLDAPVQRYLPWFRVADPRASAQMTVRQLLNQTSGLPSASGWVPLADFDSSPGRGREAGARPGNTPAQPPAWLRVRIQQHELQPARLNRRGRQRRKLRGLCPRPHLRAAGHAPQLHHAY